MAGADLHLAEGLGTGRGLLKLVALVLALSAPVVPLHAQEAPRTGRWHFVWDAEPRLRMSVHFTRSAAGDETRLLVEAAAGRFILTSRQDPGELDSYESIRSVDLREELSRRLVLRGVESVPACKGIAPPDACIVVEGKNGQLVVALSKLSGDGAPPLRDKLLALSSETFRKRLVELAPVFPKSLDLARYADGDFLGFLYPGVFRSGNVTGTLAGGCEFDSGFGYPCSEKERRWESTKFGMRP